MSSTQIGKVKSGKGKTFNVSWNSISREVFVSYAGGTLIGKASSTREAIMKAETYLYNK